MIDKKDEIYNLMKQYVNTNNCIDISKFHKDYPKEYALLPHYFGGVNQAIEQFGWVKVSKTQHKQGTGLTLRNQLAYDMLRLLRNGGKINAGTLQEIADKYRVTRPAINQLYKALENSIDEIQNNE